MALNQSQALTFLHKSKSNSKKKIDFNCIVQAVATRCSFESQFNDMVFHKFLQGRLVFLYGTSNAGKSSILTQIKLEGISKGVAITSTGTDAVWGLHIYDLFFQYNAHKAIFLNLYLTIDEIFDCIWNPEIVTKLLHEKNIEEKNRKEIQFILQSILDEFRIKQKDLLNNLRPTKRPVFCERSFLPALELGQIVVVDSAADPGDIDEFFRILITNLVHCKTDIVIVYCSPNRLMERLYSRNEEALNTKSLNKGRPGAFPLEQFEFLYEKTTFNQKAVDNIGFSDIQLPSKLPLQCKILSELIGKELGSTTTYDEREWQKAQSLLQKSFSLQNKFDRTKIKPKINYQFLVNSGEDNAKHCAKQISSNMRLF